LILAIFLPDMLNNKKQAEEEDPDIVAAQTEIDAANEENEKLKAELRKLREEMESKANQ